MPPVSPQACLGAFEGALQKGDLDAALAVLADDVVFFYSNGAAHWGKAAIRAAIQANWDSLDGDNYATRDHIWVEGDAAAACLYSFSWTANMDGKDVGGKGRGTTVFRREPAGWRIASEHLSNGRWRPKSP
ncbi:MAG: DUF4440 domain-containing protein [Rhizomicrobium sp.]